MVKLNNNTGDRCLWSNLVPVPLYVAHGNDYHIQNMVDQNDVLNTFATRGFIVGRSAEHTSHCLETHVPSSLV